MSTAVPGWDKAPAGLTTSVGSRVGMGAKAVSGTTVGQGVGVGGKEAIAGWVAVGSLACAFF
ncbi:MAG: hypothetical protein U0401_29370 [Anaerolineae bacterium]